MTVFLRGGADGLSLVAPLEDDAYYRARPRLAVAKREALALDGFFGLNPALQALAVDVNAAAAANTAIIAVTDPDSPNPASATFTAAVLEGARISWANIGDSRTYWIPDAGTPLQLSVDDSLAQAQIASGVPREVAENGPQAHAITKWLGRDSEDFVPTVGSIEVSEPGGRSSTE